MTGHAPPSQVWLFGSEGTLHLEMGEGRLSGGRRTDEGLREIVIEAEKEGGWRVGGGVCERDSGVEKVTHTSFEDGVRYMGVHGGGDAERAGGTGGGVGGVGAFGTKGRWQGGVGCRCAGMRIRWQGGCSSFDRLRMSGWVEREGGSRTAPTRKQVCKRGGGSPSPQPLPGWERGKKGKGNHASPPRAGPCFRRGDEEWGWTWESCDSRWRVGSCLRRNKKGRGNRIPVERFLGCAWNDWLFKGVGGRWVDEMRGGGTG